MLNYSFILCNCVSSKVVCSDVNCLNDVCGMGGVHKEGGDQWFRLITAIFLHIGEFCTYVQKCM